MLNSDCIAGTTGTVDDLGSFPTKKAKFCAGSGAAALCPVSCDTCTESCADPSLKLPFCVEGVTATTEYPGESKKIKFCVATTLTTCAVSCGTCVD